MQKIENNNCEGLCCYEFCGQKYTHYHYLKFGDKRVHLCFCDKHAEEFDEIFFNEYQEKMEKDNKTFLDNLEETKND